MEQRISLSIHPRNWAGTPLGKVKSRDCTKAWKGKGKLLKKRNRLAKRRLEYAKLSAKEQAERKAPGSMK